MDLELSVMVDPLACDDLSGDLVVLKKRRRRRRSILWLVEVDLCSCSKSWGG